MLKKLLVAPVNLLVKPFPRAKRRLDEFKVNIRRWHKLRYFIGDITQAKRFMFWAEHDASYAKLSAELIFQYHKLEKGLCISGPKRFFGRDPVLATCGLVARWHRAGFSTNDPVYIGAIETLRAYRNRLDETPPPPHEAASIFTALDACIDTSMPSAPDSSTPVPYRPTDGTTEIFDQLCKDRRSVRSYSDTVVPLALVQDAIAAAQLSPSACNRQPWLVHIYRDPKQIARLLELQNGNTGFGHQLSTLIVICADSRYFFDASERNQPYIDSGLFSMSLILALQARGIASCCLNWCVAPDLDQRAHQQGNIADHEKIIMYLAVGYASANALVPRSPRRTPQSMTTIHDN